MTEQEIQQLRNDGLDSVADYIENLRTEKAELGLKSCTLDLTKGHLKQCEAALESRDKRISELEKDVAFLQSCINSGETATKADRPSEKAKILKDGE